MDVAGSCLNAKTTGQHYQREKLLFQLDSHERPTLRFPVLLYLFKPLCPLCLKPLFPIVLAAIKIIIQLCYE